ncbi:hypothetical protein SL1157_2604 [Ruegeria lacuscaerulensis ITI-1157]|nr:hypothetical protein SL1157_2604 [Ruegeria lacuscaerulensis ITI-1157]SHJ15023.1 hypothetical protein SAMN05444404_1545 [Ruegeria lacuscaerulensis ITI-1157]
MKTVFGQTIPSPRVTRAAVFLLAIALSVPVFVVLSVADWLWF